MVGLTCGAFFLGAGVLAGDTDIPDLLRLLFGAVGAAMALGSAWTLFRALHLRIDHTGLSLRRRLLGLPVGGVTVPRRELASLALARGMQSSSGHRQKVWFGIQALTTDGRRITIGQNLPGRDAAEQALALLEGFAGLGEAQARVSAGPPGNVLTDD